MKIPQPSVASATPAENSQNNEFWHAPEEALFKQGPVARAITKSEAWMERARWAGSGPPFLRIGRNVVYRKADVLEWLKRYPTFSSTSGYPQGQAEQ
jgi:hypothetical protein